jgi:hypothetical protein
MSEIVKEKCFRLNDVYLVRFAGNIKKFTILEICGKMIKHNYGWDSIEDFNSMIMAKYGTSVKILGIFRIIKKDK